MRLVSRWSGPRDGQKKKRHFDLWRTGPPWQQQAYRVQTTAKLQQQQSNIHKQWNKTVFEFKSFKRGNK